jgi:glycerol-3-phosphate dehydrogenase
MGEDAVNRIEASAGLTARPSVTKNLRLHGYSTQPNVDHMQVYGSDAPDIVALIQQDAHLAEALHPDLPYVAAEVIWAVRMEQAMTVEDVLARRTRALLLNASASIACARKVAQLMAQELDKDETWVDTQVSAYTTLANGYRVV